MVGRNLMSVSMFLDRKNMCESLNRLDMSFVDFDFLLLSSFWAGCGHRIELEWSNDILIVTVYT